MCGLPNYPWWEQDEQSHGLYDVRPLAGYGHVILCDVVTGYGRARRVKAQVERRVQPLFFQGELSQVEYVRKRHPCGRGPRVARKVQAAGGVQDPARGYVHGEDARHGHWP